jgi:hypothetical protein
MANRRHSSKRIKRLRHYDTLETALATGASRQTVRRWRKEGLQSVEGLRPPVSRGEDLIAFLKQRNAKRKRPCGPGRLTCFRCKSPKRPAGDRLQYRPDTPTLGMLCGECPDCGGPLRRRASLRTLKTAAGELPVSILQAYARLMETP